ncbi:MAG: MGMT family protein [Firmicutes bacterium]|nr:MGMT family protein [Bacillota bacterium]
MNGSYELIYALVRQIPEGRVSSYGSVARMLGQPRWARLVGYAMRACHDPTVPCHRVLQWDGSLAPAFGAGGPELQQALLEAEGVEVTAGRVDLARFGWEGI